MLLSFVSVMRMKLPKSQPICFQIPSSYLRVTSSIAEPSVTDIPFQDSRGRGGAEQSCRSNKHVGVHGILVYRPPSRTYILTLIFRLAPTTAHKTYYIWILQLD